MTDPRRLGHEAALNRYWNGLVQPGGDPDADPGGLDPEVAGDVRRLQALGSAAPPPSSRERVRRAVHAATRAQPPPSPRPEVRMAHAPAFDARPFAAPHRSVGGRPRPVVPAGGPPPAASPPTARRWFAPAATALLVVLTVALGIRAFGPHPAEHGRPGSVPALVASPAVATPPATDAETLVEAAVPGSMLPAHPGAIWHFEHYTIQPYTPATRLVGATWDAAIGDCCPGLRFEFVLEGSYAVRPSGTATAVRAGGGASEVRAGDEVILGPGDALLSRSQDPFDAANVGPAPVELLTAVLTDEWNTTYSIPAGWELHDYDDAYDVAAPDSGGLVRLRRADLAAKTSIATPPGTIAQVAITTAANASLAKQADGAVRNIGNAALPAYLLSLEPADPALATPASSLAADETLAAFALPAGVVPARFDGGFGLFRVPPRVRTEWTAVDAAACCSGQRIVAALDGSLALRIEGPARVLRRASAAPAEVAPGTDVVLAPGDALSLALETPFVATNPGTAPSDILAGALVFEGMAMRPPVPSAWVQHDEDVLWTPVDASTGPTTLRLERGTIAAGAVRGLPAGGIVQLAVSPDERSMLAEQSGFAVENLGAAPATVYVLTLLAADVDAGTAEQHWQSPQVPAAHVSRSRHSGRRSESGRNAYGSITL